MFSMKIGYDQNLVTPSNVGAQSEIQLFSNLSGMRRILRSFDGERSPSLIAGHLEPATRLDKRGEGCTEEIRDGVIAASSFFVYNVVT